MGLVKELYFGKALMAWQPSGKKDRVDALLKRRAALNLTGSSSAVVSVQPLLPPSPAAILHLKIQEIDQHAQTTISQGKLAEAEQDYREWIKLDPDSIQGYVALAGFFRRTNKPDQALSTLKEAARLDKTDTGASCYFAELSLTARSAEANAIVKLVADKQKTQPALYANLGQAFLAKGDLDQAQTMNRLGLDALKNGTNASAFAPDLDLLQGDILAKQGKKSEAEAAWKKAAFATTGNSLSIKEAMNRLTSGLPTVSPQQAEQSAVLFGRAQNALFTNPQEALLEIKEAMRLAPKGRCLVSAAAGAVPGKDRTQCAAILARREKSRRGALSLGAIAGVW